MVKRRRTRLRDGPPPWTVRDTIQMVIVGTVCFIALLLWEELLNQKLLKNNYEKDTFAITFNW
jgi:hypothetical protein